MHLVFLLFVTSILLVQAEQLYVNSKTGNDSNSGTKVQPLKTIMEAAKRVNSNKRLEATHNLSFRRDTLINPNRCLQQ
ncbi:DUF1565 domain-containing protein [Elizabethkingia anophelis]|uniref:Uncharacterized protein n=1 Tax=Elizabethkingia anophelis TaxID=1117645 RepID=A0A7Z7PXT6_9FLAO|nr:DUF1565 domain-containing protein [Elizabethkingia anophelis]STC97410.1 Uncharacterised protein [Elizabethkingia anophelis]